MSSKQELKDQRAPHREHHALLFSNNVSGIFNGHKCSKAEPMVYRRHPRRLERLTIYRCHYKGSTFSSVINIQSVGPGGV